MKFHSYISSIILIIACVCKILTVDIKPELKSNVLNLDTELILNTKAYYIVHLIDSMW